MVQGALYLVVIAFVAFGDDGECNRALSHGYDSLIGRSAENLGDRLSDFRQALGEQLFDGAEVLVACPARSSEFMIIFLFMASAMTVSYSANSFFTESQSAFICETL